MWNIKYDVYENQTFAVVKTTHITYSQKQKFILVKNKSKSYFCNIQLAEVKKLRKPSSAEANKADSAVSEIYKVKKDRNLLLKIIAPAATH